MTLEPQFDIDRLIDEMIQRDYTEQLRYIDSHARWLDSIRLTAKHPLKAQEYKITEYRTFFSGFAWFIRYGSKPAGVKDWVFLKTKRYTEHMIKAGMWKETALQVYDNLDIPPMFRDGHQA